MLHGPTTRQIPVMTIGKTNEGEWVLDSDDQPGVRIVNSPVEIVTGRVSNDSEKGFITVAVEPGHRAVISTTRVPWKIGRPSGELVSMARRSLFEGQARAEVMARESDQDSGFIRGARNEPMMTVRLNKKCNHESATWQRLACGHVFCKVCDAHIDPSTRNASMGPGSIVACNRRLMDQREYLYLFEENMAGSARLTEAMKRVLPPARVARPRDIKFDPKLDDLLDNKVYEAYKKSIKSREVLYRHYSPSCNSFSGAQRGFQERSKAFPYGLNERQQVEDGNKLANRVVALATMIHAVGDFFSIEHIFPTAMLEFDSMKMLLALPGVHLLTFDNCAYGAEYRHRQCIVTNAPWLVWLSQDCNRQHDHMAISAQNNTIPHIKTKQVQPFHERLVERWSLLFRAALTAPKERHCAHCAHLLGGCDIPAENVKPQLPPSLQHKLPELKQVVKQGNLRSIQIRRSEAVLVFKDDRKHLGAREEDRGVQTKFEASDTLRICQMDERAVIPARMSGGAAGYDLYNLEKVIIQPGKSMLLRTGIAIALPEGTYGRIAPRSGLAASKMIAVGAGVIDGDYRGEIKVLLFNHGSEAVTLDERSRVAQLILERNVVPEIEVVSDLGVTARGSGGFGSTGVEGLTGRPGKSVGTDRGGDVCTDGTTGRMDPMRRSTVSSSCPKDEGFAIDEWLSSFNLFDDSESGCEDEDREQTFERLIRQEEFRRVAQSYKNVGKRERQAALLPELEKIVAEKRKELWQPERFPTLESRRSEAYRKELEEKTAGKIGGTAEQQRVYFDEVLARYPECFWLDGCAPPKIADRKIRFRLKPGAKPVARQPIPLSPYDDIRVEYHIEENLAQGKLRRIDPQKEPLPEWATPVFVVDQDAKGLLGRMVCAYGPVNKELECGTFPSADPERAFRVAAGKKFHTVVDAIWGYTQFELDDDTKKLLVICSRSGLYEWTRMPFGPSPAPAEMQSYVHHRFGSLRGKRGEEFCTPCMDDVKISSTTFEEHLEHMRIVCETAAKSGFEFKATKGQYCQNWIIFWGCVCDEHGRRAEPKKIQQLSEWPTPDSCEAVNSFLAFVNYLREHMNPEWVFWEKFLRPCRRKGGDFKKIWNTPIKAKMLDGATRTVMCQEAFERIRSMLAKDLVLHHADFEAAADPAKSGRPLELFIDASDYGWCATLTQRLEPHGAPKIIAIVAKGFSDVQLRWSAMERELYALWQGVVSHERLIKGFKTFCYIDHKNNLFSEAQLDNRRRSKKMSNWALELQGFDIVRVWIRGEANILSDAPSRAPWESAMAKHLPIPDEPVRELVNRLYQAPEALEALIAARKRDVHLEEWRPLDVEEELAPTTLEDIWGAGGEFGGVEEVRDEVRGPAGRDGYQTPTFGMPMRLLKELGRGGIIGDDLGCYPNWPFFASQEPRVEDFRPGTFEVRPVPVNKSDLPIMMERNQDGARHDHFVVRWARPVLFTDGEHKKSLWFSVSEFGEAEARRQAWSYFKARYRSTYDPRGVRLRGRQFDSKFGPLHFGGDGNVYHGDHERHEFTCYPESGAPGTGKVWVRHWDHTTCTMESANDFCGNYQFVRSSKPGVNIYKCCGHHQRGEAGDRGDRPGMPVRADRVGDVRMDGALGPEVEGGPAPVTPRAEGLVGDMLAEALAREERGLDDLVADVEPVGAPLVGGREEPVAPPPGVEPVEPGDAPRRTRGRERKQAVMDYWEPVLAQSAWVRHHVTPRRALYIPDPADPQGPGSVQLSKTRVTHLSFKSGLFDVRTDQVDGPEPRRLMDDEWVGETWFYLEGREPASIRPSQRRRIFGKSRPMKDMPEPEILAQLRTGAGLDRGEAVGTLDALGIERTRLAAAQLACKDFAEIATIVLAWQNQLAEANVRKAVRDLQEQAPELCSGRNIDNLLVQAESYELVDRVLHKRVFNNVEGTMELKLCVPDIVVGQFEMPGQGLQDLRYREKLLLEYHNSALAGHMGRERTYDALARDFWWPGMYEDTRRWCHKCEQCAQERGSSGASPHVRTEFYSRPFRVLQYDTVKCRDDREDGSQYILTVIDCFSRWPWLIPIKTRTAVEIARGLLTQVMLGMAGFPVVLRSDNAKEFVGETVSEMNRLLGIASITGSSYHPQSQGMVESMHRTLNQVVRGLVKDHPSDWEERIPFAQSVLRMVPLKALNGRSPYEVVLGLKFKLPSSLLAAHQVESISTDEYVERLGRFFNETYRELERTFEASAEKQEGTGTGKIANMLEKGDLVKVKREPTAKREGPLRFQERTYPGVYRIKGGTHPTFQIENIHDPEAKIEMKNSIHAERLIKLDMPELKLGPNQPRTLQMLAVDGDPEGEWETWNVKAFAADGMVKLQKADDPRRVDWVDLSKRRYRWLLPGRVGGGAAAAADPGAL